jgi:exopolyphosphatase / guanosine-5'-triphosphate,3'-diphosphate pyrophosphatase
MRASPTNETSIPTDLSSVRPRWEWRVFEAAPGLFTARIALPAARESGQPSHETYLISEASPNNVKIRSGVLDVKVLEQTSDDGLELWRPVFKHAFPIAARELSKVWWAWNLESPAAPRSYTLASFRHMVGMTPELRAIEVVKTRVRFDVLGCSAERASLSIGGVLWETVAVEHENPERVARAIAALGDHPPTASNYPALLRRLAGSIMKPTRSGNSI